MTMIDGAAKTFVDRRQTFWNSSWSLYFWNETCDIIFTLCLVFTLHFQASQSLSISLHLLQLSDEGKNSLSKTSVCEFARSYTTTRMEERWIWTRANSSTIRPQLKYWLWRILIQKYYVCFSLTLAFASNTTTRRIFFLVSTNEHSHFIFVLSREFLFFKQVKWNISLSHAHTLFFHLIFMIFFWDTLFFHCNWLHIKYGKYAGNHQLKSLRSDACEKKERTANWSIN